MTIDEAIGNQSYLIYPGEYILEQKQCDAIKLGIEALKRHKDIKQYSPTRFGLPLPGETEEVK